MYTYTHIFMYTNTLYKTHTYNTTYTHTETKKMNIKVFKDCKSTYDQTEVSMQKWAILYLCFVDNYKRK